MSDWSLKEGDVVTSADHLESSPPWTVIQDCFGIPWWHAPDGWARHGDSRSTGSEGPSHLMIKRGPIVILRVGQQGDNTLVWRA